jgi:hypothetical protein
MPPANQPTVMGEALSHKKFGPTCFIWNLSVSRTNSVRYYHMCTLHLCVKCPICLSDFNQNWTFETDFNEYPWCQISSKLLQWEDTGSRWKVWKDRRACIHDEATRRFFGTLRTHVKNASALYALISSVCRSPTVCILPVYGIWTACGL